MNTSIQHREEGDVEELLAVGDVLDDRERGQDDRDAAAQARPAEHCLLGQ